MAAVKTSKKVGGGGAFLDKPGIYHLNVLAIDEQPCDKNNSPIDGWKVTFGTLHGEENGKQIDVTFYNPKETDEEKRQEFAMRKQTALLIATGLITEQQLGDEVDVDLQSMLNRQVIADLELSKPNPSTGKQFLQLAFDRVFHIDDPRHAKTPKSVEAINLLPKMMRRDPKSFDLEKLGGKSSGHAAPSNGHAGGNGKAAADNGVNLDDI